MVVFSFLELTIWACILSIGMKNIYVKVSLVLIIISPDHHAIAVNFILFPFAYVCSIFFDISTSTIALTELKVALVDIFRGNDFNTTAIRSVLFIDFA